MNIITKYVSTNLCFRSRNIVRTVKNLCLRGIVIGGLVFATAAQASVHEIKFDAEQRYQVQDKIAAGASIEVCGDFQKGQSVTWSYQAERPLDFNIHFHVGKKVSFPAKLKQKSEANGNLKAKLSQTYCWMWTNSSGETTPLNLQLSLKSGFQKRSTM